MSAGNDIFDAKRARQPETGQLLLPWMTPVAFVLVLRGLPKYTMSLYGTLPIWRVALPLPQPPLRPAQVIQKEEPYESSSVDAPLRPTFADFKLVPQALPTRRRLIPRRVPHRPRVGAPLSVTCRAPIRRGGRCCYLTLPVLIIHNFLSPKTWSMRDWRTPPRRVPLCAAGGRLCSTVADGGPAKFRLKIDPSSG